MGRGEGLTRSQYTVADIDYVREGFLTLDELCGARGDDATHVRAEISAGRLPRPSYVLPDGAEMFPDTYFRLADEAGGVDRLREHFLSRYRMAAARDGVADDPEDEWRGYLSGEYGVCLREVTPESIARKAALVDRIETLLSDPRPKEAPWRDELRVAVDELDALERPFAPHYDRIRFGAPSSRDRLITSVRTRYPAVFTPAPPEPAG
jgi:hypothetical protein